MSWLSANWPAFALAAGSLLINAIALAVTVRMHCRNDDRKYGELVGRVTALEGRRR